MIKIERVIFILTIIFILIILYIGSEKFTNAPKYISMNPAFNLNTGLTYYNYAKKHETNPEEILKEGNINLVENCIMAYKMAYKYGINNALFDIGRIYHFGIRNQGQSLKKAFKYYVIAYNNSWIEENIKDKIIDNIITMSHENDKRYADRMLEYVINGNNNYKEGHVLLLIACQDRLDINVAQPQTQVQPTPIQRVNNLIVEEFINNIGYIVNAFTTQLPRIEPDTQNVHDNTLGTIMNSNIINLSKTPQLTSLNINEIFDLIHYSNEDLSVRSKAKKVLEDIIIHNAVLSRYNKSELEILELVWNRINELDKIKADDAKTMLVKQLADGYENGAVVCATGRAMRVLSALDGIDETFETGITKNIVSNIAHTEIMNKAAVLRNSTNLEGDELKNYLKSELHKEYVEGNLMGETAFNNSINSWINFIE